MSEKVITGIPLRGRNEMDEVKSLYYEDLKDKKRAATGARYKAAKKQKGKVMFPMDYAGDEYTKPSEVQVYRMVTVSLPEFKAMNLEDRRNTLQKLLANHTRKEIASAWGITMTTLYYYVKQAGLTRVLKPKAGFEFAVGGCFTGGELRGRLVKLAGLLSLEKNYQVNLNVREA